MGVFSAMLTGVSGLQGQSIKMGAISDNIANVNTVGYKRADVPFQTMVTESMTNTRYAPGGALSRPRILISQQGIITSSQTSTDMAISGRGFFVTSDDANYSADSATNYTRAGSFRPSIDPNDSSAALLQNTAGQYLLGWEVGEDGTVSEANQTLNNLNPVNINRITATAEPTENVFSRMNVPAETVATADPIGIYGTTSPTGDVQNLTFTAAQQATINVSDGSAGGNLIEVATSAGTVSLTADELTAATSTVTLAGPPVGTDILYTDGAGVPVTITYAEIQAATPSFTNGGSLLSYVNAVNNAYQTKTGNTDNLLNLNAGGAGATVNAGNAGGLGGVAALTTPLPVAAGTAMPTTLDTLTTALNGLVIPASGTLPQVTLAATFNASGQLSVSATSASESVQISAFNVDINDADATALGYTLAGSALDGALNDGWRTHFDGNNQNTFQVYDALGAAHNVTYDWKKVAGEENLWEVRISNDNVTGYIGPDGAFDPASNDGARFVVDTADAGAIQTQRLFMQFNGDGSLAEIRTTKDGQAGHTLEGVQTSGTVQNRETTDADTPKLVSVAIGPTLTATSGEALVQTDPSLGATPLKVFGGDGAPTTAQAIVFEWNLGRPTSLGTDATPGTGEDAITQNDSGEKDPTIETFFYGQDGARYGNLSGVSVDENGLLWANYNNGLSRPIYQLPVATFANADGLIAQSGNIFTESPDSGQVQLRIGGMNGAGKVFGSSLEQSNVDLGDEFTTMIVTQQAFTANTRTITTSDRMLEELVRILR